MKLSACVIVKNEEENLPVWLECMREVADELVVVDTGSADGTVELARAAGARVFSFAWVNDFSAAKNFAIEQAKGDWILFLDADEYFPKEQCKAVRHIIEKYRLDPKVTQMAFLRINIEKETGQDQGTSLYVVRCFKNCEWLRYRGRIHENLADIRGRGRDVTLYVKEAVIYHTGYSDSVVRDKLRRNLRFLQEKERLHETQPLDDFYFADCHYGLGEYEKAAEYAKKAVEQGIEPVTLEERPHSMWIQSMMVCKRPREEILAALKDATQKFPQDARFYLLWGIFDWDCGDYAEAERHFLRGRELYQRAREEKSPKAGSAAGFYPTACAVLGEIAAWKGNRQSAVTYLAEGLKLRKQNAAVLRRLCRLLEEVPTEDFIAILNGIYDKREDGSFLAEVLAGTKQRKASLYYERSSGRSLFRDDERYIFAGKFTAAAEKLMENAKKKHTENVEQKECK